MAEQRPSVTIGGLGTGGLVTAAGLGFLSQRHPEFLDFSQNVLDIAPLGIIAITIGGALGEGVRRLFRWAVAPKPAPGGDPGATLGKEGDEDAA